MANKWNSTTLVDDNFTKDDVNKALLDVLSKVNQTYSKIASSSAITSDIYDSGTNPFGNWIRYKDGTMQCWQYVSLSSYACTTATGSSFTGSGQSWTFPQSFISPAVVNISGFCSWAGVAWVNIGTSSNTINVGWTPVSSVSNTGTFIGYLTAIGKWANGIQTSSNTYNITTTQTVVRAEYINGDAAAITTPINYGTVVEDTNSAVTTGTGTWKFTAPISGVYEVEAMFLGNSGDIPSLFVNNSRFRDGVGVSGNRALIATTVRLAAGQWIDVRNTSNAAIVGTSVDSYINITMIGK